MTLLFTIITRASHSLCLLTVSCIMTVLTTVIAFYRLSSIKWSWRPWFVCLEISSWTRTLCSAIFTLEIFSFPRSLRWLAFHRRYKFKTKISPFHQRSTTILFIKVFLFNKVFSSKFLFYQSLIPNSKKLSSQPLSFNKIRQSASLSKQDSQFLSNLCFTL